MSVYIKNIWTLKNGILEFTHTFNQRWHSQFQKLKILCKPVVKLPENNFIISQKRSCKWLRNPYPVNLLAFIESVPENLGCHHCFELKQFYV